MYKKLFEHLGQKVGDHNNFPSQTKSGFFTKKRGIPEFFTKSAF